MTKPITNKRRVNIIKLYARDVVRGQAAVPNQNGHEIGSVENGVFMALFASNSSKVMMARYMIVRDRMDRFARWRFLELRQYHRRAR